MLAAWLGGDVALPVLLRRCLQPEVVQLVRPRHHDLGAQQGAWLISVKARFTGVEARLTVR